LKVVIRGRGGKGDTEHPQSIPLLGGDGDQKRGEGGRYRNFALIGKKGKVPSQKEREGGSVIQVFQRLYSRFLSRGYIPKGGGGGGGEGESGKR